VAFSRLASKRSWQFGPQHGPSISHSNKLWRFPKSWGVPPNHPRLVIDNGKTNGLGYRSHILGTPPSPKLRHLGPSCAKRLAAEAFHSLWRFERKLHSSLWPGWSLRGARCGLAVGLLGAKYHESHVFEVRLGITESTLHPLGKPK
jgi:hypothetical protein